MTDTSKSNRGLVCVGRLVAKGVYDADERRRVLASDYEKLERELAELRRNPDSPAPTLPPLEREDWTPRQALDFYAAGRHFDVVNGRTRILDTGAIASDALKQLSPQYAAVKGLTESVPGIEPWQVPLWDAINRYVVACHGNPSKHVYGNTARQTAVAEVNDIVRDASQPPAAAPVAWRKAVAPQYDYSDRYRYREEHGIGAPDGWEPLYTAPRKASQLTFDDLLLARNCLTNLVSAVERFGPIDADIAFAVEEARQFLGGVHAPSPVENKTASNKTEPSAAEMANAGAAKELAGFRDAFAARDRLIEMEREALRNRNKS